MTTLNDRLRSMVSNITTSDPELAAELERKRSTQATRQSAKDFSEALNNERESGYEAFQTDSEEAVILKVGRPSLRIFHNEAELIFEESESEVWEKRLQAAKVPLSPVIPAVGRIEVVNHPIYEWCGTGWLVYDDIVVTNRHVAELFSRYNGSDFVFKTGIDGQLISSSIDLLQEYRNEEKKILKVVKIIHIEPDPGPDIAFFKVKAVDTSLPTYIPLYSGEIMPDMNVAVISYPAKDSRMPDAALMDKIFGEGLNKKRLAPGKITSVSATLINHNCSTLGGSSGGVIVDLKSGKAVALHFGGRFLETNYAVPAALIDETLNKVKRGRTIPEIVRNPQNDSGKLPVAKDEPVIANPANTCTFSIPLQVSVSVSLGQEAAIRPNDICTASTTSLTQGENLVEDIITEGRPEDYADRIGYVNDFLGNGFVVPLPEVVNERRKGDLLTYDNDGQEDHVLRYSHFSVVMSRARRLCLFSAVNINGAKSKSMGRAGWKLDPRIPASAQVIHECYGPFPKYSRGHMTRREDPIWGKEEEALQGNADSMCVTNVVPQMQSFNSPVWLGLENYALSHAREDKMRISVFTGPIFQPSDKVEYGVKIPVLFWKIIVFIHDETDNLSATGYIMSQEDHLPETEFVFGAYGTAQTSIANIERMTGLSFGGLRDHDVFDTESVGDGLFPLGRLQQVRF